MFKKSTIYTLALAVITVSLISYGVPESNHSIVTIKYVANAATVIPRVIETPAEVPFPPFPPIPVPLPPLPPG